MKKHPQKKAPKKGENCAIVLLSNSIRLCCRVANNEKKIFHSVTLVDEKMSNDTVENNNNNNNYCTGDVPKIRNLNEKQMSWIDGIFGCMKPVLSLIGKGSLNDVRMRDCDDWIIPFELISGEFPLHVHSRTIFIKILISDIEWLGSGAQGAVFSGKLYNEIVAVKKVKDVRETDIRHLRKLNHENIVKFR